MTLVQCCSNLILLICQKYAVLSPYSKYTVSVMPWYQKRRKIMIKKNFSVRTHYLKRECVPRKGSSLFFLSIFDYIFDHLINVDHLIKDQWVETTATLMLWGLLYDHKYFALTYFSFTESCKTLGTDSEPCVFPFIYEGVRYNQCTSQDAAEGAVWCATQVSQTNGTVIEGRWGDCTDGCPGARKDILLLLIHFSSASQF